MNRTTILLTIKGNKGKNRLFVKDYDGLLPITKEMPVHLPGFLHPRKPEDVYLQINPDPVLFVEMVLNLAPGDDGELLAEVLFKDGWGEEA